MDLFTSWPGVNIGLTMLPTTRLNHGDSHRSVRYKSKVKSWPIVTIKAKLMHKHFIFQFTSQETIIQHFWLKKHTLKINTINHNIMVKQGNIKSYSLFSINMYAYEHISFNIYTKINIQVLIRCIHRFQVHKICSNQYNKSTFGKNMLWYEK